MTCSFFERAMECPGERKPMNFVTNVENCVKEQTKLLYEILHNTI